MTPLEQYLINIGYKRYRKAYEKKEFVYIPDTIGYYFSTMVTGWLDYRYLKGDHEIIFGLNEKDKPPTLIYPRPKNVKEDDVMNRVLKDNSPEEIYKMIL